MMQNIFPVGSKVDLQQVNFPDAKRKNLAATLLHLPISRQWSCYMVSCHLPIAVNTA
jgi:hypothetical protein